MTHRRAQVALIAMLGLVATAVAVPIVTGWDVHTRNSGPEGLAPWHGYLDPKIGLSTVPALLIAATVVTYGPRVARDLSFRRLLLVVTVLSAAWLAALALVDGVRGISGIVGNPFEYLPTARDIDDVPGFLDSFTSRVPRSAPNNWPVHVSGHPPGMTLFFVALVRLGLGGDLAAGLVIVAIAATIPAAVLTTLRLLGATDVARAAAPFLVISPAAIFLAVSADAVMAAAAAWGLAALAAAAMRSLWWAIPAGLLLGALPLLSYGLGLVAVMALAVLVAARSWRPLLPVSLVGLSVPLAFAAGGFWWPEGFDVVRDRYWDGIAADRPALYWIWANLALLVATVGPWASAGLAGLRRLPRAPMLLIGATLFAVLIADLSLMSKAEVERIWLPFMPWLMVAAAALPGSRRSWLAGQAACALALEHLLYTSW